MEFEAEWEKQIKGYGKYIYGIMPKSRKLIAEKFYKLGKLDELLTKKADKSMQDVLDKSIANPLFGGKDGKRV